MISKKRNNFITEISEEDFRKLDLVAYEQVWVSNPDGSKSIIWKKVSLNEILDRNIEYWLERGYETDKYDLTLPVTVAIHVENGPEPSDYYFDKYMNHYSMPATYEFAMGIPHIYTTRDYYMMKGDYWRVKKNETKALYRIHLDEKHLDRFVLKHKSEIHLLHDTDLNVYNHYIERNYDLDEESEEESWILKSIVEVKQGRNFSTHTPITPEKERELIDNDGEFAIKC